MDELMTAADLFVGKPGGLTTSEALAKGLPMIVINPIPGQEERNSDHLLEEGIALRCNNLPALAFKIDRLISDPGKLMLMRGNALALAIRRTWTCPAAGNTCGREAGLNGAIAVTMIASTCGSTIGPPADIE